MSAHEDCNCHACRIDNLETYVRDLPKDNAGIESTTQFTFVVDSDESLLEWANNDKSKDQNYTSVLIKSGTWRSTTGVNLTTSGTKVVVGEPGNKLVFSNSEKGLYYNNPPNNPEYYMLGVKVKSTNTYSSGLTYCYAFHSCSNLTNCTGTGIADSTGDAKGYGFFNCSYLTNCEGSGNGEGSGSVFGYGFANCGNLTDCYGTSLCASTFTGSGYGFYACTDVVGCRGVGVGAGKGERAGSGYGFCGCSYLSNCTGSGAGNGEYAGSGYSFVECDNLTNCRGTITSVHTGYVFWNCSSLTNCSGRIKLTASSNCFYKCSNLLNCTGTSASYGTSITDGNGIARGFWECSNLSNCTGSGTSDNTNGYGFLRCSNLINCAGTGITKGTSITTGSRVAVATGNVQGYGFFNCTYVSHSKAGGRSTTGVFSACYALGPNVNACAATTAGGFNNPTNPSE